MKRMVLRASFSRTILRVFVVVLLLFGAWATFLFLAARAALPRPPAGRQPVHFVRRGQLLVLRRFCHERALR